MRGQNLPSKYLIRAAGVGIVANHGLQLSRIILANIGMALHSSFRFDYGNQDWTTYYGPLSGLIESVTMIAFGVVLLRSGIRAGRVLLWLLPVLVIHDLVYGLILNVPFAAMSFFLLIDITAWLALLLFFKRTPTA